MENLETSEACHDDDYMMKETIRDMEVKLETDKIIKANPHFADFLKDDKLCISGLMDLPREEQEIFCQLIQSLLFIKEGEELDKFLYKIDAFMEPQQMERLKERNRARIAWAVTSITRKQGRMPTQTQIADITGLSRLTVRRHMKELPHLRSFDKPTEQYKYFAVTVMDKLTVRAIHGDVKAAKLFFERMDKEFEREENEKYRREGSRSISDFLKQAEEQFGG